MRLTINAKQLDVGAALQEYIEEQPPTIMGKHFEIPNDGHVAMFKEGSDIRADVSLQVGKGIKLQGHAIAGDAYAAFDEAAGHLGKRLPCYKRCLRYHHKGRFDNSNTLPVLQYIFAAEEENTTNEPDQPVIVPKMETEIDVMTPGDAVVHINLANLPALMFRNVAHSALNMVYRLTDGDIGWVDLRGSRGGVPEGS